MQAIANFALRIIRAYLVRLGRGTDPWEGVPSKFRDLPIGRLNVPSSLAEWSEQRETVKALVLKCLGDLPPRPSPLKVRTVDVEKKNGYSVEKFIFDNGVDSEVAGYIAIPSASGSRYPAILTMHGHTGNKDHMFGRGPASHHNVAERLVRRGYVVLGIDDYFSGERKGKGPAGNIETLDFLEELSLVKVNLWLGRTLWGMMLRDKQIALDYLASRPEVDPDRIGAQGMSLGSTHAWWLGAIDDRVKAAVAVGCFTRYEDLIAARELRSHGIYYFVYGILKNFDSEGIMSLLAPRPFLALTGDRDPGSPLPGIRKLEEVLRQVYALYGRTEAFRSVVFPKTGHTYTEEMKVQMVDWFEQHL